MHTFLKISIRRLRHSWLYSIINIIGLATGITCTLLAVLYWKDEHSFDGFHKNNPNLYRVTTKLLENKAVPAITMGGTGQVQGPAFKDDVMNNKNRVESSSGYRYQKLVELIRPSQQTGEKYPAIDYLDAAAILRNQTGLNGANIGYTNEKNLNQLICHHSVIFKPSELKVWVSTSPFQIGRYVCYDLNKIFKIKSCPKGEIYEPKLTIKQDTFLTSAGYIKFLRYRYLSWYIKAALASGAEFRWNERSISDFISTNPSFFRVYEELGDYFKKNNEIASALKYYNLALTKEIPLKSEVDRIKETIIGLKK